MVSVVGFGWQILTMLLGDACVCATLRWSDNHGQALLVITVGAKYIPTITSVSTGDQAPVLKYRKVFFVVLSTL